MSNRTMIEINHDRVGDMGELWLYALRRYVRSGDPKELPVGVTFFGMRHHSEPCPLGEPPRGWDNDAPTPPASA